MSGEIKVFRGRNEFLSNLYTAPFEWDGRSYQNSEAAFQSAKSLDPAVRDTFSDLSGKDAKREGKRVALRWDWEHVKDGIMEEVVRAKFTQNPELLRQLIETGDAELIEGNRWHDTYWGVDLMSGDGENHLGIILMKVRAELGGEDYQEKAARMKAEKEQVERDEKATHQAEIDEVEAELTSLPAYEFAGKEMGTKGFGRVTILRQEGNYLIFNAKGMEKKFALPGCVIQGFLIPDDPEIVEVFKRRETLLKKLEQLRKKGEE